VNDSGVQQRIADVLGIVAGGSTAEEMTTDQSEIARGAKSSVMPDPTVE